MIRVLHVIGRMNRGGAETMIMNIYRNIDKSKVQFDFVESTNEVTAYTEEITSLGGKIYKCPHYNGLNHFEYIKWWKDFFNNHSNDYKIVHGHIGSTAAIYLKIAKKYNLITIAHSHSDSSFWTKGGKLYWMFAYPTRYISDYFFGCSKDAGIARYGKKVTSSNKFKVINNAIDLNKFTFNHEIRLNIRNEFGIRDEILLGHVGRMDDNKNQRFIIDLIEVMHNQGLNVKALLVGTGVNFYLLNKVVKEKHLDKYVFFTGVRSDVLLGLYINDELTLEETGEIQLTETGISGICTFNISSLASKSLNSNNKVSVKINFVPQIKNFKEFFATRNEQLENRTIEELLESILNYKLTSVILKKSQIKKNTYWNDLNNIEKELLIKNIESFELNINSTNSYDKAQVCTGGIPLNEIDCNMESNYHKNLYFVGEILDVDGKCGGFNLAFAFITGYIAGSSV